MQVPQSDDIAHDDRGRREHAGSRGERGERLQRPRQHALAGQAPPLDEGSHRNYAIQWFAFAIISIVGLVIFLRRT